MGLWLCERCNPGIIPLMPEMLHKDRSLWFGFWGLGGTGRVRCWDIGDGCGKVGYRCGMLGIGVLRMGVCR